MNALIYDLETDGFLDIVTKIHCLVIRESETDAVKVYTGEEIREGFARLAAAPLRSGHNVITYDDRVFAKLGYGHLDPDRVLDTITGARVRTPDEHLKHLDYAAQLTKRGFPDKLVGKHSLEAWGYRLGEHKQSFDGPWDVCTPQMIDYCVQDTATTRALFNRLMALVAKGKLTLRAWRLEQDFARVLDKQMQIGVAFDEAAATELIAKLQVHRVRLEEPIQQAFPPFEEHYVTAKKKIPKVRFKKFNPNSHAQIARVLMERFGWVPSKKGGYTKSGRPKTDESVLSKLKYPGVPLLVEYMMVKKRLGQISDGEKAWLKLVKPDKRIYGVIHHNSAVTGRCTHSGPNLSQVPSLKNARGHVPYGLEMRRCFIATPGNFMVGADASGIDLRMLGHYLYPFDGGKFIKLLIEGDIHTHNQKTAGIDTRDRAKRFIYAWLYGAQDGKLSQVLGVSRDEARKVRLRFLKRNPALAELKARTQHAAKTKGVVRSLDGRLLHTRSPHSALNTLLQGGAAVVMKQAVVLIDRRLDTTRAKQVLFSHDEVQLDVTPGYETEAGEIATTAITESGILLGVRTPLAGAYKVGRNWAETH